MNAGHAAAPARCRSAIVAADQPEDGACAGLVGVVDDNEWVRDSRAVLLETFGFTVLTYGSGGEFPADKRRRDIGCLIVDQHMSGLDGLTVLAALQRQGLKLPAILITGRADAEIVARVTALGAKATLEKPFSVAQTVSGGIKVVP